MTQAFLVYPLRLCTVVMASSSAADHALAATPDELKAYFVAQGVAEPVVNWFLVDCGMGSIKDFIAFFLKSGYEEDIRKQLESKFTVGHNLTKEKQRLLVARVRIPYEEALKAKEAN